MRRLRVAVAAVVVLGLLSLGAGASGYVRGRLCEASTYVSVDATDAEPTVAYDDLSRADRRLFEAAVSTNGSVLVDDGDLANGSVVGYEGDAYRVTVIPPGDCAPYHPLYVELPLALGGGALLVGGVAVAFISLRSNAET